MAAAILVVGPVTAASADSGTAPAGSEVIAQTVTPMTFKGYDRAVAEANGFRIVVDQNGVEQSIPVTAVAKDTMLKADAAKALASKGQASTTGTVTGPCGSSTLTAAKLANDTVAIYTGYSVYLPVSQRHWGVYANGVWTGFTYEFPSASTGPAWYTNVAGSAVGGGWAGVTYGSSVIMVNGGWCASGGPTAWFG